MMKSLKSSLLTLLITCFLLAVSTLLVSPVFATDWRRPGAQREAVEGTRSGSSGGSSGSYNGPNLWNMFKSSGPSAADIADQQARSANEQGVAAYNRGDWATAIALFKQSLQNFPNDPTYRQNLVNAETNLANQQAKEKAEREEKEKQRQNKAAADNMQQSIRNFAQTLNASPISGGLDFDGRTAGTAPDANSGGLDFTSAVAAPGKSAASGDPMVVDARNVPSGLPKDVESAIAGAYQNAPPGVSDRVRKGFQAVMERDWKAAKAWFQDALNRDPANAGLKRLVALTDSPQQPGRQSATVDARNEPAGLGGTGAKKGSKAKPASNPNLQLPDPDDIRFLFPGLQKMKDREAPVYKTLPDGRRVQMPQDSDLEYLFGPGAAPKTKPTYIIGKKGQLIQVPDNSNQNSPTYVIGQNGELIEIPQPKDILFMYGNPDGTPK